MPLQSVGHPLPPLSFGAGALEYSPTALVTFANPWIVCKQTAALPPTWIGLIQFRPSQFHFLPTWPLCSWRFLFARHLQVLLCYWLNPFSLSVCKWHGWGHALVQSIETLWSSDDAGSLAFSFCLSFLSCPHSTSLLTSLAVFLQDMQSSFWLLLCLFAPPLCAVLLSWPPPLPDLHSAYLDSLSLTPQE